MEIQEINKFKLLKNERFLKNLRKTNFTIGFGKHVLEVTFKILILNPEL